MEEQLHQKYGLVTAIALVVGIVIGSGVFFKAESIQRVTDGNLPVGIAAWLAGGLIMLVCACMFAVMAGKFQRANGIVDYAAATVGGRYAYAIGWFMATVYYPTLVSVLAWLTSKYTLLLFGQTDASSGLCLALACLYLVASFTLNTLSAVLAGKVQVVTTVLKLIPLLLMAVVGTAAGVINGTTVQNFAAAAEAETDAAHGFFAAVVSTAFAYEGWIVATSINAELKNARRNLPIALIGGSLIVIAVYVLYYLGLSGALPAELLMERGVAYAFASLFGPVAGAVLTAFVAVSCMGTLNGVMLGCVRGMYALAVRGEGPRPAVFGEVDHATDMPANSAVLGLLFSAVWLFYYYGAHVTEPIFGLFNFDSSEMPAVTTYAMYIPIFVMYCVRRQERGLFKGYILPAAAVLASLVMIAAAVYAHGVVPFLQGRAAGEFRLPILSYLIVFGGIMAIGMCFAPKGEKRSGEGR